MKPKKNTKKTGVRINTLPPPQKKTTDLMIREIVNNIIAGKSWHPLLSLFSLSLIISLSSLNPSLFFCHGVPGEPVAVCQSQWARRGGGGGTVQEGEGQRSQ